MASRLMMWLIGVLICIGAFLNGLRFARMSKNPWAGKSLFGFPVQGADMPLPKLQLIGRIQMIAAPLFLTFWTLMLFGFLGPVEGIQTIKFN